MWQIITNPLVFYGGLLVIAVLLVWLGLWLIAKSGNNAIRMTDDVLDNLRDPNREYQRMRRRERTKN